MKKLSWYVVQVATNMEDKAQEGLIKNILGKLADYEEQNLTEKANNLKESFDFANVPDDEDVSEYLAKNVILVPKERVDEQRAGKRIETKRKIFPGYLLVKMAYDDEYGLIVRKTQKISGFVGVSKDSRPVPISKKEIDSILQQISDSQVKAKQKVEYVAGEKIRIIDGPFLDFSAVIEDVVYDKFRLKVNVQIFGRETSVELDFSQVEKISG